MIGVLDLQGGVAEHLAHLHQLGVPARAVKRPGDLDGAAGLILPGGESTCLRRLLRHSGLDEAICRRAASGMAVWGTCAGAILVATAIEGEEPVLGLVDMTVRRNAFGSQLDSFTTRALVPAVADAPLPLVFIRAPQIVRIGAGVQPLLVLDGYVAAAESPGALVTVFHPELSVSLEFHRHFAAMCGCAGIPARGRTARVTRAWPPVMADA